jgi:hypothetical protein
MGESIGERLFVDLMNADSYGILFISEERNANLTYIVHLSLLKNEFHEINFRIINNF